ncbi:MAG: zinc ribbon domain-containing protein [Lachnospiraceae bacterium]|nr:zinc ribbon domain-containing protein [Lachnospiraceae bacterium]
MAFCKYCGQKIGEQALFCKYCGQKLRDSHSADHSNEQQNKSNIYSYDINKYPTDENGGIVSVDGEMGQILYVFSDRCVIETTDDFDTYRNEASTLYYRDKGGILGGYFGKEIQSGKKSVYYLGCKELRAVNVGEDEKGFFSFHDDYYGEVLFFFDGSYKEIKDTVEYIYGFLESIKDGTVNVHNDAGSTSNEQKSPVYTGSYTGEYKGTEDKSAGVQSNNAESNSGKRSEMNPENVSQEDESDFSVYSIGGWTIKFKSLSTTNKILAILGFFFVGLPILCGVMSAFLNSGKSGYGSSYKTSVVEEKIAMPKSSSYYSGKDYKDVVKILEGAGFTNVSLEPHEDLITGWLTSDGSVERVSVGGYTDFSTSDKFKPDTEIIILYHAFPKSDDSQGEELTTNAGVQENGDVNPVEKSGFDYVNTGFSFCIPDDFVHDQMDDESIDMYYNDDSLLVFASTSMGVYGNKLKFFANSDEIGELLSGSFRLLEKDGDSYTITNQNSTYLSSQPAYYVQYEGRLASIDGAGSAFLTYNGDQALLIYCICTDTDARDKIEKIVLSSDLKYEITPELNLGDNQQQPAEPSVDSSQSIYELAYEQAYASYSNYYLFDIDNNVCISFTSNGYGYYGQYTGDLSSEVIVYYPNEGYSDTITFKNGKGSAASVRIGDDSVTYDFKCVPVADAEKYLKSIN